MKPRRLSWLLIACLLAGALLVSSCGTVHGLGQDIKGAGQGLSDLSDSTREAIAPAPPAR
ncbi:small secreted protein [bacterium]|nr:small secreted protein [bacterium]